jgi:poly(3-hydroxyalkanoate) synthetase
MTWPQPFAAPPTSGLNYVAPVKPAALILLYWNSCSGTNLLAQFYAWYLRNTY